MTETWVDRLQRVAQASGYDWTTGEIGRHLKMIAERLGEERTVMAWTWWVQNALAVGEPVHRMNPRSFARHVGYWLHLANPVRYE